MLNSRKLYLSLILATALNATPCLAGGLSPFILEWVEHAIVYAPKTRFSAQAQEARFARSMWPRTILERTQKFRELAGSKFKTGPVLKEAPTVKIPGSTMSRFSPTLLIREGVMSQKYGAKKLWFSLILPATIRNTAIEREGTTILIGWQALR